MYRYRNIQKGGVFTMRFRKRSLCFSGICTIFFLGLASSCGNELPAGDRPAGESVASGEVQAADTVDNSAILYHTPWGDVRKKEVVEGSDVWIPAIVDDRNVSGQLAQFLS